MKTPAIISIIIFLIFCGVGYRFFQIFYLPVGTGEESKSPNGKYIASVTAFYDEDFWGYTSSWYEFELKEKDGRQIRSWKTDTIPSAIFGSRTDM
ncbi:MAG: hypothetical protein ACYTEE_12030, partial [Planctomycetota bacterium]